MLIIRKKSISLLVFGIFLCTFSKASILIVNTPTLDPSQLNNQSTSNQQQVTETFSTPSTPDSFVNSTRLMLLQKYGYQEIHSAVMGRQQALQNLSSYVLSLVQQGTNEQNKSELDAHIRQIEGDINKSLQFLSEFELNEFKKVYSVEQQNERMLQQLKEQIGKVKIVETLPQPMWDISSSASSDQPVNESNQPVNESKKNKNKMPQKIQP